jgi:hypothetical protein
MHRAEQLVGSTFVLLVAVASCSGSKSYDDVYVSGGGQAGDLGDSGGAGTAARSPAAGEAGAESAAGGTSGKAAGGAASGAAGAEVGEEGVDGDLLYFKASNPDAQDAFGTSLALSANWLAVSAPRESSRTPGIDGDQADDSEDRSGAVYLFSREVAGWAQRAYVKASTVRAGDNFGYAIAFSGQTLAVATPYEDSAATGVNGSEEAGPGGNHGAVYVFVEQDGAWEQQAYIKATNTDWIDLFGTSVALSGDTLVVGAPWEDSAATGVDGDQESDAADASGAAYVYERSGETWQPLSYLKASNTDPEDNFGHAVALSGDTLVVGAPGEASSGDGPDALETDNLAPEAGAVYVFQRTGSTYEQTAYLKASNSSDDDHFGGTLALDGDTLAIGASIQATSGSTGSQSNELLPESGAVYVFERQAEQWVQTAYLKAKTPAREQYFGEALALRGDTLVVGALGDDYSTGAAYVYQRTANGWQLQERMTAPNAESADCFGSAIAISDDYLAIAAYNEAGSIPGINGNQDDNRTPGAGAAYLWKRK